MGPVKLAPLGFQTFNSTALASAVSLTAPATANVALMSVNGSGAGVNWRDDGTAPTGSIGMTILATAPVPFEYYGNLSSIEIITEAGTPTLNVSYYKIAG